MYLDHTSALQMEPQMHLGNNSVLQMATQMHPKWEGRGEAEAAEGRRVVHGGSGWASRLSPGGRLPGCKLTRPVAGGSGL